MKKWLLAASAALALTATAGAASATVIVLGFDDLNGAVFETVDNYYNGGFGGSGTGPGPSDGITFSHNAIAGCVAGNACASTNSALVPTQPNLLFFLTGPAATMDVAGGFDTGFSFFYSTPFNPGFVNVWSGLDGTGSLLATVNLPTTPNGASIPGCFSTNYCPYVAAGVSFAGVAHSVDFGGVANFVSFDSITLGSATAGGGGVPEPATWALMISGMGLAGAALRRRRSAAVAA